MEVRDRSFNPPILVIEEGDRIWWFWDKNKVSCSNCLFYVKSFLCKVNDKDTLQSGNDKHHKSME